MNIPPSSSQLPVLVGERIFWLCSGSGLPKPGTVRWIGHLPEMGQADWTVGIELDDPLPYGGIDGAWGQRTLFTCKEKHGLIVPITQIAPASKITIPKHQPDNPRSSCSQKDTKIKEDKPHINSEQRLLPVVRRKRLNQTASFDQPLQQIAAEKNTRINNSNQPLAITRKKYQKPHHQRYSLRGRDSDTEEEEEEEENKILNSSLINQAQLYNKKQIELKYNSKENNNNFNHKIDNTNIVLDGVNDEKYYDCFNKLDTLRVEDKANLLLNKYIDSSKVQDDSINKNVQIKRMISNQNNSSINNDNIIVQAHRQTNSNLEGVGVTVSDTTVFAARRQIFYRNGRSQSDETHTEAVIRSSLSSSSGTRKEKTASGLFSFFKWFKKDKEDDDDDFNIDDDIGLPSVPASPKFIRSQSSSCGSVDTLFSTATASSFAFVHPAYYRPYGQANQPETRITDRPETYTYRQRVQERDRRRELERGITLKKKYNLFGSSTIHRSADDVSSRYVDVIRSNESLKQNNTNRSSESLKQIKNTSANSRNSTISRKKRKAPPPPTILDKKQNDYSLPNTLEHLNKSKNNKNNSVESGSSKEKPHHRRTVSESSKDKKAGAYCHVRGKRKAPQPPSLSTSTDNSTNVNKLTTGQSSSNHSLVKKKRPAPQPPVTASNSSSTTTTTSVTNNIDLTKTENKELSLQNISSEEGEKDKSRGSLSPEEKERLLKSIAKLQVVANRRSSICTPPSSPSLAPKMASYSISNDSLKLERGVLKSTKSEEGTASSSTLGSPENKFTPASPVSPRPWYKRHIMKDHGLNNNKLFDKKKDKAKVEDWMPEVGIARTNLINHDNNNKFNIFSKAEKNEEKRKSQISMLVNISELDREAAEIVQKEHAKEKAILAAEDAKFYSFPENTADIDYQMTTETESTGTNIEVPKRSSARELISLFNAITNVTRVTVNTSFFSKDGTSLFSREGKEKRFSFGSTINESNDVIETKQVTAESIVKSNINNNFEKESLVIESRKETYLESPGETRRRWNRIGMGEENDDDDDDVIITKLLNSDKLDDTNGSRVTIEEIDEFDVDVERSSKTQALYEANRLRRHHSPSPSIPTIVEQSESITSSVATSPGSTSNRSQVTITPTTPTKTFQQTIAEITPITPTEPIPIQQNKRPVSIWSCPQCTLENPRWRLTCEACDMWKPPLQQNNKNNSQINNLNQTDKDIKESDVNKVEKVKENIDKNIIENTAIKENSDNLLKEEKQKLIEKDVIGNENIEEVRKARIAFFHKNQTSNMKEIQTDDKSDNKNNNITAEKKEPKNNVIDDEQAKLKEMLKDLKHSLPKRHKKNEMTNDKAKQNNNNNGGSDDNENNKKEINNEIEIKPAVKNLGAIKKIPQSKTNQTKSNKKILNNNINEVEQNKEEKAEIYLIKTETIIEDIKIKKPAINDGNKAEKVSTSVQTSAMVRKAETQASQPKLNNDDMITNKPPSGQSPSLNKKEITLPVTVEEYTIKDGVLYTSLSKEKKKIGTGTFELILARDFAGIKATKTGKELSKPPVHHVYANVPNPNDEMVNNMSNIIIENGINDFNDRPAIDLSASNNARAVEQLTAQLTQPKGLADFKAGLESEAAVASAIENGDNRLGGGGGGGGGHARGMMMNTIAVNRLLRRLEVAIAKGQLKLASKLAKELAQLKINCSVTRHKTADDILVDIYVEDKVSHQGPIPLMISPNATVAQLKIKVEKEFEIPVAVQRWILGKQLAVDDTITLTDLGINTPHSPIFLYLVAPEMAQDRSSVAVGPALVLDQTPVVVNTPQPPPPPENMNQRRGGWYYNDEEDKYSFCEDETESETSASGGISRVATPQSLIDDEYSENEEIAEVEEEEEEEERPPTPPERHVSIEQPPPTPTGTLALGWKCELCTLVNSPTRPGCAACTNPRPINYQVPKEYQVSQHELQRMEQEQLLQQETAAEKLQNYQALVDLENADIVLNTEQFECPICFLICAPQDGVILRDCLHMFCRGCLINTVQFNEEAEVKCPYRDNKYACDSSLLEREIKAMVPKEVYEQHLAKSVAEAENKIGNAFHCKTPDCPGWCIFEDNVNEFLCPVCQRTNCLTCQAIHAGINCKQFQERAKQDSETNADARRTNEMLEEMVERGEAMKCPTCQVILMKKWGCDWLRCSMCKTEICWVTRGPRWGPQGKGDTSGGCQCGVNGIKCHPKCNYCH